MPEWSAFPPLRSTSVWIKRQTLFTQFDSLLNGRLGRYSLNPRRHLINLKVSKRPTLEQFALRSGASVAVATVLGGTESIDTYWVGRITRPTPSYPIYTCDLYVDSARNLYMSETAYDRFQRRKVPELSRRMRPVTIEYLYRERLLTRVVSAMLATAVA